MDVTTTTKMPMTLSPEQERALGLFRTGNNLFITGPGGTGKTKLIHDLVNDAKSRSRNVQVCAMTGCAALLLTCGARTLHSWSGIKLARGEPSVIISNVYQNSRARQNWRRTDVLILDEVSMLSSRLFDILDDIGRLTRNKPNIPFGGMQVVFTGDFFQLPPVSSTPLDSADPSNGAFCFESERWYRVFPLHGGHVELTTMFRQTDPEYVKLLMEIRRGELSEEGRLRLDACVGRKWDESSGEAMPTKLFPIKSRVESVNQNMFAKLETSVESFDMIKQTDCCVQIDNGKPLLPEVIRRCRELSSVHREKELEMVVTSSGCASPLELKVGAAVMCTFNVDLENGICNGSQGTIVGFRALGAGGGAAMIAAGAMTTEVSRRQVPVVKFSNGHVMTMERQFWQSEDYPCLVVWQFPLCLAWALTIHKIQGATIAAAMMDIGHSVFEYGQTYVALSRVQSLEGLYLASFQPNRIKAHEKVIKFYENLQTAGKFFTREEWDKFGEEELPPAVPLVEVKEDEPVPVKVQDPNVKICKW